MGKQEATGNFNAQADRGSSVEANIDQGTHFDHIGQLNIYANAPPEYPKSSTGKPLHRPLRAEHFKGREDQIDKTLRDLHPGRVITLCGAGGIGKTALAAEVVWRLAPGNDPERPHLLYILQGCVERCEWKEARSLARTIEDYLDIQGHWMERLRVNEAGLNAAQGLGDHKEEGSWLGNLGNAYYSLGQVEKAIMYYEQALTIARQIDDRRNEGIWLGNLGIVYRDLGQMERARQHLQESLAIFEEIKSPQAQLVRKWLEDLNETQ